MSMTVSVAVAFTLGLALISALVVYHQLSSDEQSKDWALTPENSIKKEETPRNEEQQNDTSVEYVLLEKLWPPLPPPTLPSNLDVESEALIRHHSGHFRGTMAEVWDSHPQYKFTAFGKTFHLDLKDGHTFALPSIKMTHILENSTKIEEPGLRLDGCFYSGTVRDDPHSSVAVNLCHGMRGHIRTSHGSYFIEPAEPWMGRYDTPIKHAVTKYKPPKNQNCLTDTGNDGTDTLDYVEKWKEKKRRRKRELGYISDTQEYTIELMVAVDKKTADYHKEDLMSYILTLISSAADNFKDPSIGNPINIAVVRFVVLGENVLTKGHSSNSGILPTDLLKNFCAWQALENAPSDDYQDYYDSAILITRENLCVGSRGCENTLGLANLARICVPKESCSLVVDNGLHASFTIAHELGHVLSMPHDGDSIRCRNMVGPPGVDQPSVMAKMLDQTTYPWSWSKCSSFHLTEFLESGQGNCLQDSALKDILQNLSVRGYYPGRSGRFPGEMFNQCELIYGSGAQICMDVVTNGDLEVRCKRLWCKVAGANTCVTNHLPWANGTPCGNETHHMWCINGNCSTKDSNSLRPINGGWGDWDSYGECSRTCGGGVKKAERLCNNPEPASGGRYCVGGRLKYKSCNTQECPPDSIDFRAEQCAKNNNNNFSIPGLPPNVTWVPKYKGVRLLERCALFCHPMLSVSNMRPGVLLDLNYRLKDKVTDGTPCGLDTFDVCINGVCHPAGCDHVLNSTTKLDYCGECGGNNSTCEQFYGEYDEAMEGYRTVVRIPRGSFNIDIRQYGYNGSIIDNYLALADGVTNEYILNGDQDMCTFKKSLEYGDIILDYSGSGAIVERINTSDTLNKDLIVKAFSMGTVYGPKIFYQYSVLKSQHYKWIMTDDWMPCDQPCNGEKRREARCVRRNNGEEVSDEMCSSQAKPYAQRAPCNSHCNFEWIVRSHSECSSSCGPGYRTNNIECVKVSYNNGSRQLAEEHRCEPHRRPPRTQECTSPCDNFVWTYTSWGPCSKSCGGGVQKREAYCVDQAKRRRDSSNCKEDELLVKQACNTQDCPYWKIEEWTPCSVSCGIGNRQRPYSCISEGVTVPDGNICNRDEIPKYFEVCIMEPCPEEYWIQDEWSSCSKSCDGGERSRIIKCSVQGGCANHPKPHTSEACSTQPCPSRHHDNTVSDFSHVNTILHSYFVWRPLPWSTCSVSCGEGEKRRELNCFDKRKGKMTDPKNCLYSQQPVPAQIEPCSRPACDVRPPMWVTDSWRPCSAIQGQGTESRSVYCVDYKGHEISSRACTDPKPDSERMCNVGSPRNLGKWNTGKWSNCSQSCGGGLKRRMVQCEGGSCDNSRAPISRVPCNTQPCPEGHWKEGHWSQCNAVCGRGYKQREVRCERKRGGEVLPESSCPKPKPETTQTCQNLSCDRASHWQTSRWSQCSRSCGKGVRRRDVVCISGLRQVGSDHCRTQKKPKEVSDCQLQPACPLDWAEGPWSQCSTTCGRGKQNRSIWCVRTAGGGGGLMERVDNSQCDSQTRPELMRHCPNLPPCSPPVYKWVPGPWQPCNHPCNKKGRQIRKLSCYRGNRKVRKIYCPTESRPKKKQKCSMEKCFTSCSSIQRMTGITRDGEYKLLVRGRNVSIYCHEMHTSSPKEYLSLPAGEGENFAEIYDKRLVHPATCPEGGQRTEYCQCVENREGRVGFTGFKKIRLNITSLIVDGDDLRFTVQVRGRGVSYGEAGDCYSKLNCPQGEFKINLAHTGFRISPTTSWNKLGQHVSQRIRLSQGETKAEGKCGGYCGLCSPKEGIKLDVLPP